MDRRRDFRARDCDRPSSTKTANPLVVKPCEIGAQTALFLFLGLRCKLYPRLFLPAKEGTDSFDEIYLST